MKRVQEIRSQLSDILKTQKMRNLSCGSEWDVVRQAICSAYFSNAARLKGFSFLLYFDFVDFVFFCCLVVTLPPSFTHKIKKQELENMSISEMEPLVTSTPPLPSTG